MRVFLLLVSLPTSFFLYFNKSVNLPRLVELLALKGKTSKDATVNHATATTEGGIGHSARKVTIRIITVVRWVTPRGAGSNPVRDMVYQTLLSIRQSDRRKRTTSLCLLPQFTTTPQASHSFSFSLAGDIPPRRFSPLSLYSASVLDFSPHHLSLWVLLAMMPHRILLKASARPLDCGFQGVEYSHLILNF